MIDSWNGYHFFLPSNLIKLISGAKAVTLLGPENDKDHEKDGIVIGTFDRNEDFFHVRRVLINWPLRLRKVQLL